MALDLSVVIVNWNLCRLLLDCLRGLPAAASGLAYDATVVDNASHDGSPEMVSAEFPDVRLIRNSENLGFARANNQGIRLAAGRYILLLNNDTILPPGALTGLVRFMDEHPDSGAAGPRLLRPDGTAQPYAFGGDPTPAYLLRRGLVRLLWRRPPHDWATERVQEVDWVSGACLLARGQAVAQVGLLDENIFMYFEDNDWCLRLRQAGWKVYYDPQAEIVHLGGQSLAQNPAARASYYRSLAYFYGKHYGPAARTLLRLALAPYRRVVGH